MPSPRDVGGVAGQVPAVVVPPPNDKSINKIKHEFLISTPFEFFIRSPFCLKRGLGESTQVRFAECDERPQRCTSPLFVWRGFESSPPRIPLLLLHLDPADQRVVFHRSERHHILAAAICACCELLNKSSVLGARSRKDVEVGQYLRSVDGHIEDA